MKQLSIVVAFALLVLGFSGVLTAEPTPETDLSQVQQETSVPGLEAGTAAASLEVDASETQDTVKEVPAPDGTANLTLLSHNDPPSCNGPFDSQVCSQWGQQNCHPPTVVCFCAGGWVWSGGTFVCPTGGGVCDCA